VKGTLTKVEWTNPHTGDVKDDNGQVVNWSFEGYRPSTLRREGWTRDMLEAGQAAAVFGYAAKDGSHFAAARKITLSDGKALFASAPPQQVSIRQCDRRPEMRNRIHTLLDALSRNVFSSLRPGQNWDRIDSITEVERKIAARQGAGLYVCFAWRSPVREGKLKAMHCMEVHCMEVAFVGPERYALAARGIRTTKACRTGGRTRLVNARP
jgi:hypothetical protein